MFSAFGGGRACGRDSDRYTATPFSDGGRGQAGVVPRWFVTSDARIRHVEMRLQWTCLAVRFLGCSVQEC